MNSLSWMIYLAEVVGSFKNLLIAIAVISAIGIPCFTIFFGMAADVGDMEEGSYKKPLRFIWLPLVAGLIASLTPSTKAVYLIAASEAGETVIKSPEAVEMFNDLKTIIRQKLKDEVSKEK